MSFYELFLQVLRIHVLWRLYSDLMRPVIWYSRRFASHFDNLLYFIQLYTVKVIGVTGSYTSRRNQPASKPHRSFVHRLAPWFHAFPINGSSGPSTLHSAAITIVYYYKMCCCSSQCSGLKIKSTNTYLLQRVLTVSDHGGNILSKSGCDLWAIHLESISSCHI